MNTRKIAIFRDCYNSNWSCWRHYLHVLIDKIFFVISNRDRMQSLFIACNFESIIDTIACNSTSIVTNVVLESTLSKFIQIATFQNESICQIICALFDLLKTHRIRFDTLFIFMIRRRVLYHLDDFHHSLSFHFRLFLDIWNFSDVNFFLIFFYSTKDQNCRK